MIAISCSSTRQTQPEDFTQFVNPFVGAAENGHCFPGATIPFGMIQAGPETGNCWYWTSSGEMRGFIARSVVGGVYIKLLKEKLKIK